MRLFWGAFRAQEASFGTLFCLEQSGFLFDDFRSTRRPSPSLTFAQSDSPNPPPSTESRLIRALVDDAQKRQPASLPPLRVLVPVAPPDAAVIQG